MGSAQGEENMCNNTTGTFTDPRDGKVYKTVKIGNQVWMAENLAYDVAGSKCYDNDPANSKIYGRLYTWKMAKAAAPLGWHLPSDDEWQELVNAAGGKFVAGTDFKTQNGWNKYIAKNGVSRNGNGTDAYGFSALGGGYHSSSCGFRHKNCDGRWWSSSQGGINACKVSHDKPSAKILHTVKGWFCSVRYVQD